MGHKRLWCVYEAFIAKDIGKPVILAGAAKNFVVNPWAQKCFWIAQVILLVIMVNIECAKFQGDGADVSQKVPIAVRYMCNVLEAVCMLVFSFELLSFLS